MPLPNVSTHSLVRMIRYYQQRVAEAAAAMERKSRHVRRLTSVAESARRLAAEAENKRSAAVVRWQLLAAEAPQMHHAEDAEGLAAEAAKAERLAAEAEAALQQLCSSAVPEPGARAALGGRGEVFAGWEKAFIADEGAVSLLLLITVRLQMYLPP